MLFLFLIKNTTADDEMVSVYFVRSANMNDVCWFQRKQVFKEKNSCQTKLKVRKQNVFTSFQKLFFSQMNIRRSHSNAQYICNAKKTRSFTFTCTAQVQIIFRSDTSFSAGQTFTSGIHSQIGLFWKRFAESSRIFYAIKFFFVICHKNLKKLQKIRANKFKSQHLTVNEYLSSA